MTCKGWILWGIMLCLFLTGCNDSVDADPNLFKPDQGNCWPCQMYMSAFLAFSATLENALPIIASNALKILPICLTFWLMYKVFPWVVSLSPPDFKKDFVVIIKVLFKTMIVALFFANPGYFYTMIGECILQPVGTLFLKVSELVLANPNTLGVQTSQYAQTQNTFLSGLTNLYSRANQSGNGVGGWSTALFSGSWASDVFGNFESAFRRTYYPNGRAVDMPTHDRMFGQLPLQIQSVIWQIYSALWSGMGLVFQLFRSNNIAAFLSGVVLGFALCQLMVFLPLSFIDAFLRMGMGILLLPIFMLVWIFPLKIFEGLGKRLVELVLAAFFDILFHCIYVAFLISVLRVYVKEKIPDVFNTDFQASESHLRSSGTQLTSDFLVMFVLVYTVFKLSDKVDDMAGQFFDGAGQGTSVKKTVGRMISLAATTGIAVVRACFGDFSGFKKVAQDASKLAMDNMNEMNKEQGKSGGRDLWQNKQNKDDDEDKKQDKKKDKEKEKEKKKANDKNKGKGG